MAFACPYCDHRIGPTAAEPGRDRPRCAGCARPAALEDTPGPFGDGPSTISLIGEAKTIPDPRKAQPAPAAAPPAAPAGPAGDDEHAPPTEVPGYRIERELGRGGMGAVYLARQLSLDRPVALKVMSRRWSGDPAFVARFTREAFAAAQLSHPNIVQIYDIGETDGVRFFSMEYVCGRSLADLLRVRGKLDPESAVGYVLQAARGLKHAHDRGLVHRDVKPDNLLLDDQGLVKVADLGLVKTRSAEPGTRNEEPGPNPGLSSVPRSALRVPRSDLTGTEIALGTPTYMSPEQCRDAATVDHRADVYSLGCTLYVLVTGRPPFDGNTAVEVMTKHAYEPIVPPEQIAARVPAELSAVIQRMMAKDPDDRFRDMGEVVRTLEGWLGVRHAGTFAPREDEIGKLEGFVAAFNAAPAAALRGRVVAGFFTLAALAVVLLLSLGQVAWAFGVVGLAVQATLAYLVLDGAARKGPLFVRVRQFVFGLDWRDRCAAAAGLALFGLALWACGVLGIWAGCGLAGVGLAWGRRLWLDRRVDEQRRGPVEGCERLLRRMRMQGRDEEQLRQFVARFAGRDWEEFFEALFGYEAKLAARAGLLRGGAAGPRERYAGWREPLLAVIDRVEKARRAARERRLLAAVERARLVAAGLAEREAENRAGAAAAAIVRAADKVRRAEADRARTAPAAGGAPPVGVGYLVRGASQSEFVLEPDRPGRVRRLAGLLVGRFVRAALAALLVGWAVWAGDVYAGAAGLLLIGSLVYREPRR